MASLSMASINTLFKKGYLLAVVVIVANMFIGNEVRAMHKDEKTRLAQENQQLGKIENSDSSWKRYVKSFFGFLSSYENPINFIGGPLFSAANNYLKLWNYNPGGYWNLRIGCLGLRSKRFLNGMLQLEVNFNLGRGAFWLFPGGYNFIKAYTKREEGRSEDYLEPLYISFLVGNNSIKNKNRGIKALIVVFLLQGFVSMPLTLHFSKFSISISLDSLIWGITGMILELKAKKRREKEREISLTESKKIGGDDNENYD